MRARREGYSMPSTDNPIATAQREQREAAARYTIKQQREAAKRWRKDRHPGAWDGLCDWLMEECLLSQEAAK
jgi:hypothetical protein